MGEKKQQKKKKDSHNLLGFENFHKHHSLWCRVDICMVPVVSEGIWREGVIGEGGLLFSTLVEMKGWRANCTMEFAPSADGIQQ